MGTGSGAPVLFLHGFGSTKEDYADFVLFPGLAAHVDGMRRGVEDLHKCETLAAQAHSVRPVAMEGLTQLVRFTRYEHKVLER